MDDQGCLRLDKLDALLTERTRLVAVVHGSNALGTINPVREIATRAHAAGALLLVDGAQAVAHLEVDVHAMGADFYAFSGHKVYGPMGIGCLYGRRELLEQMAPYQGGGEMIRHVTFEETTYAPPPARFEAGTPNVAGAVGLAAALDYLDSLGRERIAAHEQDLLAYGLAQLAGLTGVRLIGNAPERLGILSMVIAGAHPHDVATILDRDGIAIRAGHHCAHPVMDHFHLPATARASLALYNRRAEIDRLVAGIHHVQEVLGR
ncbi:MAG: aminotransferase class V-fold PLP-dependent enzyme, partial [Deltaproteobacteria bacterium]|nr:aminotransferase class V-fold PLP-dependent enzyme [Deltaproteobacteria bacterium]